MKENGEATEKEDYGDGSDAVPCRVGLEGGFEWEGAPVKTLHIPPGSEAEVRLVAGGQWRGLDSEILELMRTMQIPSHVIRPAIEVMFWNQPNTKNVAGQIIRWRPSRCDPYLFPDQS